MWRHAYLIVSRHTKLFSACRKRKQGVRNTLSHVLIQLFHIIQSCFQPIGNANKAKHYRICNKHNSELNDFRRSVSLASISVCYWTIFHTSIPMTSRNCYHSNNEFIFDVKKKSSGRRLAKVLNTTVSNSTVAMVRDFDVIGIGAWQTVYAKVALVISETLSEINTVERCIVPLL